MRCRRKQQMVTDNVGCDHQPVRFVEKEMGHEKQSANLDRNQDCNISRQRLALKILAKTHSSHFIPLLDIGTRRDNSYVKQCRSRQSLHSPHGGKQLSLWSTKNRTKRTIQISVPLIYSLGPLTSPCPLIKLPKQGAPAIDQFRKSKVAAQAHSMCAFFRAGSK